MRISEVARATGLTVSTIRFYERRSIIGRPNRNGRNRDYSEADIRVLRFVRNAKSLGMPLKDIAEILQRSWDEGEMSAAISNHRQKVQSQIDALKQADDTLAQLETCICNGIFDCELANTDG